MDIVIALTPQGRIRVSAADGTTPEETWVPGANDTPAPLRGNIRRARGPSPPWIRRKSPVSCGSKPRTRPKTGDGRGPMVIGPQRTRTRRRALFTVLNTVEAISRRATMEGKTMLAAQEAQAYAGECWPVGEPVTLVIEEERFFGWVASASPAHSLACVAIEFTRGSQRVQERIPVENIQRLRDYLQAHPELRKAKENGGPLRKG